MDVLKCLSRNVVTKFNAKKLCEMFTAKTPDKGAVESFVTPARHKIFFCFILD